MKPTQNLIGLPFIAVALTFSLALSACGPQPAPTARPTMTPSPANDDLARIRTAGKLTVGTSGDYVPFAFYTPKFQLDGLDVALMRELGRRLGVQVVFQDFAFDGVLDALRLNQVDAVAAALTVTDARQQIADFTNSYYIGADGIIARADVAVPPIRIAQDLVGRKIGVQRGSVYETWLRQTLVNTNKLPAGNLVTYSNADDAIRDLRDRRTEVVVLDLVPAQRFTAPGSEFRLIGQQLNTQRMAIAVRRNSTLRPALDQALAAAQTDGTVSRLITQYLNVAGSVAPPTLPTPTPGAAIIAPPPAACIDGMAFITDLNYDDQNMASPLLINAGQSFVKGWRVRNSGTCPWTTAYRFDFADGNSTAALMNGQPQALGRTVNPDEVVDFQVALLAPATAGTYQGFWQMRNASNRTFGSRVWVGIHVPNTAPPAPALPTQQAGADVLYSADRTQINPGERVVFSWQVRNAQSVSFYAEGDVNAQRSAAQFNGTAQVFPQVSMTYSLRVVRFTGITEIRQIAVQVAQSPSVPNAPNAPVVQRFTLSPDGQMNLGQCVTIAWEARGLVNRVRVLRNNTPLVDPAPIIGSIQDCPQVAGQNTYTLEAVGSSVTTRAQHVLNVVGTGGAAGTAPSVQNFSLSADDILIGGCVTLTWSTANAARVRITRNGTTLLDAGQQNGSIVDCLQQSGFVGYRLEAYSSSGAVSVRERAVTVSRTTTFGNPTTQP